LTGAVEGYAGASLGLELECGVADDLSKEERCGGKAEVVVAERGDDRGGVGWAGLRNGGELRAGRRFGGMNHPEAEMGSVAAAAGGKIGLGVGGEGEQGRDQREAEEEKQDEAKGSPHGFIVAEVGR